MNVNSLSNEIVAAEELRRNEVDYVFLLKRNETFPNQQFKIHGYKLYQRDRNKDCGRSIFYINENIPCKAVHLEEVPNDSEIFFVGFSTKSRK